MLQSKRTDEKINALLHERPLRITYRDKSSHLMSCWKRITVSIHHKNLQALATEMYKVSNTSPTILRDFLFASRATPYNLQNPVSFKIRIVRQSVSLGDFKSKIKKMDSI